MEGKQMAKLSEQMIAMKFGKQHEAEEFISTHLIDVIKALKNKGYVVETKEDHNRLLQNTRMHIFEEINKAIHDKRFSAKTIREKISSIYFGMLERGFIALRR